MSSDEEEDVFREIATSAIEALTHVRLYESAWEHIVDQHGEFATQLPCLEHAVCDTVAQPTQVNRSTTDPHNTYVFISSNNLKGNRAMAVPVKVVDGTSGRVTTAMFRGTVPGEVIWKAADEA